MRSHLIGTYKCVFTFHMLIHVGQFCILAIIYGAVSLTKKSYAVLDPGSKHRDFCHKLI